MSKDAALPDRCVKCNAPAGGFRLKRKLAWHHPAIYLLAFMAVLIYALVAGIVSKRAIIYVGLCADDVRRRRRKIAVGWLLFGASFVGIILAFAYNSGILGLLGIGAFFFAVVWLIVVARVVTPKKIDDHLIWLKGINSDFLSELPPWQSQA
jgi:MFS family permease